jgi:hypothetical protein
VARQQRRLKIGWFRYLIKARPLTVLTAPIIYTGFVPFILLDLFLWLYQSICFPVYGIPKAKRSEYHEHYPRFFKYGDAESWRKGLERLGRQYPKEQQHATEVKLHGYGKLPDILPVLRHC